VTTGSDSSVFLIVMATGLCRTDGNNTYVLVAICFVPVFVYEVISLKPINIGLSLEIIANASLAGGQTLKLPNTATRGYEINVSGKLILNKIHSSFGKPVNFTLTPNS